MSMMLCWLIGPALSLPVVEATLLANRSQSVQVVYSVADLLAVDYDDAGLPIPFREDSDHKTSEDKLMRLIMTKVAPDSWASVGGSGVIQFFPLGMALIINQPKDVQEKVHQLLTSLRSGLPRWQ